MAPSQSVPDLLNQCQVGDVDAKVDALSKLQLLFEDGVQLDDIDAVVTTLKPCLRTANQHLTTAALTALPPFIALITPQAHTPPADDAPSSSSDGATQNAASLQQIRQALFAFLQPGGVIDRLGEQREKARDAARESLVALCVAAAAYGPAGRVKDVVKGLEPPLWIVEKFVKELGLGSKAFRIREQTMLALSIVRKQVSSFPIRPFLPQLVECLEDTDGGVRDCARVVVVSLFTGRGVTDAARADLKSEMTKKGVRKTIVNDVLAKILAPPSTGPGSASGREVEVGSGEEGSATSSRIFDPAQRPLGASRSATMPALTREATNASIATTSSEIIAASQTGEISEVYIASVRDLEHEFSAMVPFFEGKETEHNWLDREKSVIRLRGMLKGGVFSKYPDAFYDGLKHGMLERTLKALLSLRTTISLHACSLYAELANTMGQSFDTLAEVVLTNLLRMGGFTKKLVAQQSQITVTQIIINTSAQPRLLLPLLWNYLQEKNVQVRSYIIGHMKSFLELHAPRQPGKASIEAAGGVDILDKCLRKALADPNPGVRDQGRNAYWIFQNIWPTPAAAIMASLDGVARKQLEKVNPNPDGAATPVMSTPAPKKPSVAAAIAASRAKAKLIATAPPSLRHAATSGATAAASSRAQTTSVRDGSPTAPRGASTTSNGTPRIASPVSLSRDNGLASPPLSRSSSPPAQRPVHVRAATTSSSSPSRGKVPSPASVPAARGRGQQSPPSSPTPLSSSAAGRRTSSPLGKPAATPLKRSSLGPGPGLASAVKQPVGRTPPAARISRSSLASLTDPSIDELISATHIPLPSDSEDDEHRNESLNLMSFSSAWGNMSQESAGPPHPPAVPDSVIHDSYRAQAQQAESAAAQLLELVHEDDAPTLIAPPLIPVSSTQTVEQGASNGRHGVEPSTPKTKLSSLVRAVNDFQNSPANQPSPLLVNVLFDKPDKIGNWWILRTRLLDVACATAPLEGQPSSNLQTLIDKLENGDAGVDDLKALIRICDDTAVNVNTTSPNGTAARSRESGMLTPTTPSPIAPSRRTTADAADVWDHGKKFEALLAALCRSFESAEDDFLDHGLVLLYEMILHHDNFMTGSEGVVFTTLISLRASGKPEVVDATNAVRDLVIENCDSIIGLTTVHRCLDNFLRKPPAGTLESARPGAYCFGLVAIAKFIIMLPAEVLEEELPRLKGTIMKALSDATSASIREAAYVIIISAQVKLRDETQLFVLLSGLTETQKHLLTYEFEKMKTRGPNSEADGAATELGLRKLAGRIRHLDAVPPPAAA